MPNTPAQVGQGMSVWNTTPGVTETQRMRVQAVLSALGEELWVEEEKYIDMATALSGTGPTYVFLMMEALIDAGVHMGFPRRIAEQIVLQTVAGSVAFARDSGKHGRATQHGDLTEAPPPRRSIRWRKAACAQFCRERSMPPTSAPRFSLVGNDRSATSSSTVWKRKADRHSHRAQSWPAERLRAFAA